MDRDNFNEYSERNVSGQSDTTDYNQSQCHTHGKYSIKAHYSLPDKT